jgi:hypothetical protein
MHKKFLYWETSSQNMVRSSADSSYSAAYKEKRGNILIFIVNDYYKLTFLLGKKELDNFICSPLVLNQERTKFQFYLWLELAFQGNYDSYASVTQLKVHVFQVGLLRS